MYHPVTQNLDSVVYETQIRLFRKDSPLQISTASKELSVKLSFISAKHETSTFYTKPPSITEVAIRLSLKHKVRDCVSFFIEPTTALDEGQLMISSHSWLRNKIFSINLPKDFNLQNGLEVVILRPDEHESTVISYRAAIFRSPIDSTENYNNGMTQLHIKVYAGPPNITRPEVVECKIGENFDCLVYRPLVGFPRVVCEKAEVTSQKMYQDFEFGGESIAASKEDRGYQKAAQRIGRKSSANDLNQHNCDPFTTILERRDYLGKKKTENADEIN